MKYFMLVAVTLLTGCSSTSALYFGSYTRIGIDASTDGAGIGFKNGSINVSPTKKDGTPFDVLGTSDMDIGYTYAIIDQVVAVGDAATCAAHKEPSIDLSANSADLEGQIRGLLNRPAPSKEVKNKGPVIFGAYSSWSLIDLSWGSTAQGLNFGYKRGVGVRMPIVGDSVGSVFARISMNTTDKTDIAPKSTNGGTRNKYVFATGDAARIKASQYAHVLNGQSEDTKPEDRLYKGCIKL